jgi:hypothetical protein
MALAAEEARLATDYFQFTSLINRNFSAEQKVQVVEYLWQVAYADGHLDAHEQHFMRKIADLLYVSHADYVGAKQRARRATADLSETGTTRCDRRPVPPSAICVQSRGGAEHEVLFLLRHMASMAIRLSLGVEAALPGLRIEHLVAPAVRGGVLRAVPWPSLQLPCAPPPSPHCPYPPPRTGRR